MQNRMDWEAKTHIFIGLIFYHWHAIDACSIRALTPLLVPTEPYITEPTQMIEYISELFVELQSDICDAHERLARSWLLSPDGHKLHTQQEAQR